MNQNLILYDQIARRYNNLPEETFYSSLTPIERNFYGSGQFDKIMNYIKQIENYNDESQESEEGSDYENQEQLDEYNDESEEESDYEDNEEQIKEKPIKSNLISRAQLKEEAIRDGHFIDSSKSNFVTREWLKNSLLETVIFQILMNPMKNLI